MLNKTLETTFPEFKPYTLWKHILLFTYNQLVRLFNWIWSFITLIIQTIVNFYGNILFYLTRACKGLGLLGDVLLIPIAFLWIFSPVIIPLYIKSRAL